MYTTHPVLHTQIYTIYVTVIPLSSPSPVSLAVPCPLPPVFFLPDAVSPPCGGAVSSWHAIRPPGPSREGAKGNGVLYFYNIVYIQTHTHTSTMLQFKLVLLGDSSVGKSSIVNRFVKDSFDEFRESTIGAAFLSQTIALQGQPDVSVKFEIWDTAGQERYKSLAPMYYRNANAALVVYDITQAGSLEKAQAWVAELKEKVDDDSLVIYLVGNKVDLAEADQEVRAVPTPEAQQYADDNGLLFGEVSAKTGQGIQETFQAIGQKLYDLKKNEQGALQGSTDGHVDIQLPRPSTNDSTGCCV